jgi:hypothetical protein
MDDVRPLATAQLDELDEAENVAPGADRSPHVAKRKETHAGFGGSLTEGARPVRGKADLKPLDKRRQEVRNVCLSSSRLREGDDD